MKRNKLPSLISVLGLTLITAVLWVSFNIYRAFTRTPDAPIPQDITNPISPTLDIETLDRVQSGLYFDPSQIPDNVVTGAVILPVSEIPEETLSASPSAEIIPEEETATESSEILQ